jgi:hypothetical protein
MGSKPPKKSIRTSSREYNPRYGRDKGTGRTRRPEDNAKPEEKHLATMKEVSDLTLKQLHVLGSQKFGSSPFSEHFDRWLTNLTDVLLEFESNPNVNPDEEFVKESLQILSVVKVELEERRRKEASIDEAAQNLSSNKKLLMRINSDYASKMREIKTQKNREMKRLNKNIERIKEKLDYVIRLKTGFFRGVSKKDREQKEAEATQELNDEQTKLELAMLGFTEAQERLREGYEGKKQPVIENVRDWQKKIEVLETDCSREDRWFACEALIDAVNAFLQRKTLKFDSPIKKA